jgi:flagellar hook assembly protein FlgD
LLKTGYSRLNDHLIRGRSPYHYLDTAVRPSTTYFYRLGAADLDGSEVLHEPTSVTTPAWGTRTILNLASPTPFRTETLLNFTLAAPARARLAVYDVAGRLIRVVVDEELREGDHAATWKGSDAAGLRVAGGTYFVQLTAGDVTQTRKVVFLGGK